MALTLLTIPHYTPRKIYSSRRDWLFWITKDLTTYFPGIRSKFFIRILGWEFEIYIWDASKEDFIIKYVDGKEDRYFGSRS